MRLIFTTLGAALLMFILVLTARIWGQNQVFAEFEHPFFEQLPQRVAKSAAEAVPLHRAWHPEIVVKAVDIPTIEAALELSKYVILGLDVRISSDREVFVLPKSQDFRFLDMIRSRQQASPQERILLGGKLSQYPWAQLKEFYPEAPRLTELYQKFPQQRFFLNVIDNEADVNLAVVKAIRDLNPNDRTFIQSDTLVVMTSIKDLKPEWVYGTSQADLMRFMSFNSMWILPTTQYKGDVFVAPFTILKRPAFNGDVILEMRRRHKRVFLGPVVTRTQFDDAKRLNAEALITDNLPEMKSWLDESPNTTLSGTSAH